MVRIVAIIEALIRVWRRMKGRAAALLGAFLALIAASWIASEICEELAAMFIYSAFVIVLWAIGTALAFQMIDLLTPMLPFREIAERNPWIIVALVGIAGACVAYLLKSIKLAGLLG